MAKGKALGGQVPLTAFFQSAGSSQTSTRKGKKRKKSDAMGPSPTVSPKKKIRLRQTMVASSSGPARNLHSPSKKSQDLQEVPDSQDSEHPQDIWDPSYHRNEGQDSTPTLPKSKVQAKVYPAPPDSHLASPKRTRRDWDHQVDDDKGEGTSSQPMTREKQSRSFQVPTTPTRQSRLLTPSALRSIPLPSFGATPIPLGFPGFTDPGDEIIPSSQTPPMSPRTPKRVRGSSLPSPSKLGSLKFVTSPNLYYSSPKSSLDRSNGEVIKSSQSQELTDIFSSPGLIVIPTSQSEEEELTLLSRLSTPRRVSLLLSPQRSSPSTLPPSSISGLEIPSSSQTMSINNEQSSSKQVPPNCIPLRKPPSREELIIPETQALPIASQDSSQTESESASKGSQGSSNAGRSAQLPPSSGQLPPSSQAPTSDTQSSDPFSQFDYSQQSWERTPERLKHTADPNATEPALPSLLPVLLSVKPLRIQTFSQGRAPTDGSDDSVTESEPSQLVNRVNADTNSTRPSSTAVVPYRKDHKDDSETESETEDEEEIPPRPPVTQTSAESELNLTSKPVTPPISPSPSPPSPSSPSPVPPISLPIHHFASSHVALAPTTDIDESQTQPEESQISDTPCSIPTDYDPSGVTSQELDNIVITDAVTDFLKIFEEEEHTET